MGAARSMGGSFSGSRSSFRPCAPSDPTSRIPRHLDQPPITSDMHRELGLLLMPKDGSEEPVSREAVEAYIAHYDAEALDAEERGSTWAAGVARRCASEARDALASGDWEMLARIAADGYLDSGGVNFSEEQPLVVRVIRSRPAPTVRVRPLHVARAVRRSPRRRERRRSPSRARPRRTDDDPHERDLAPAGGTGGTL